MLAGNTEPELEQACIVLCRLRKNSDDLPFLTSLVKKSKNSDDCEAAIETALLIVEASTPRLWNIIKEMPD